MNNQEILNSITVLTTALDALIRANNLAAIKTITDKIVEFTNKLSV